jgi:STIP1 homology and U-box containing protein 1
MDAAALKQRGNEMYSKGKFGAAIEAYTEAITCDPRWTVLYINRALCHRKRKDWASVKRDCETALHFDRNSVKALYMLGLALIAEKRFTEAAVSLQKALEEARESGNMIQDDVWRELARAKYLEWELEAAKREERFSHFENNVRKLLGSMDQEDLQTLSEVMRSAREADDRSCEPPDAFCCKLTFEVFRDPVMAPSGHSYERLAILQHLSISAFDPITREPLKPNQLVTNVNLRNAAHAWLNAHAWAFGDIVRPDAPLE